MEITLLLPEKKLKSPMFIFETHFLLESISDHHGKHMAAQPVSFSDPHPPGILPDFVSILNPYALSGRNLLYLWGTISVL